MDADQDFLLVEDLLNSFCVQELPKKEINNKFW